MRFAGILTGVTILTLVLIFGVYKLFLSKASSSQNHSTQTSESETAQAPQSLPVNSPLPSTRTISSPSPSPKPKASASKSTIGTLTVLQNSTQTSSSANSTISGTISFTGTTPSGTSIVIVARINGTNDNYKTVVSGISATNNASWNWSSAQNGKTYDMIAILKGSSGGIDTDYASSQTYVVTAPAFLQVFSINAAAAPSAPTGTITTTCATHLSNNTWTAAINYESVTGAQTYKLQLGTTSGASDVVNVTQTAQSGSTQSTNTTLNDSILYYAQYAVASAPNPTAAQYSPFSAPVTVKCP